MSGIKTFPLAVVILGAGASSRMGRPKLLLPWRGTTVIGHLLAQWRQLGAAQIAVVVRPDDTALAAELNHQRVPGRDRIENPQPDRGMFSSIVCAANWKGWQPAIARWAIALGDQPHLRLETLRELLAFSAQNAGAICQPWFGGRAGHPVILPQPAFMEVGVSGAATLKEYLNLAASPRIQCPVNDAGLSLDMDTPEDYKRMLATP